MNTLEACVAGLKALQQPETVAAERPAAREGIGIRSILVPTDFSPGAQRAVEYAAAFAEAAHATITLLHVLEPLTGPELDYLPLYLEPNEHNLAREELAALQGEHDLGKHLFEAPVVRTGIAFYEITEVARELETDLVILSRHGFTGLQHSWLGSTAERVVRHAPCPVLVVGMPDAESTNGTGRFTLRIRHILAPVDFSGPSARALRCAGRMAKHFGAFIHVLYVIDSMRKLRHLRLHPADLDTASAAEMMRQKVAELAAHEMEATVPSFPAVRTGRPVQQIVSFARDQRADLVVIATHGRTGLQHVWLGSVAERVMREAPCPVLVVRPTPRDALERNPA